MSRTHTNLVLECKKCNHVWQYTGRSKYFATCSYCRCLVRIGENVVEERRTPQPVN